MRARACALSCSVDGRNYHRAANREPILKVGAPGSGDCGSVYPANAPFVHPTTGEIWLCVPPLETQPSQLLTADVDLLLLLLLLMMMLLLLLLWW